MLARCLSGILPSLTLKEALEITKIYSISGLLSADQPLITQRPSELLTIVLQLQVLLAGAGCLGLGG